MEGAETKSDWSPELYLRFASERTRPAVELLARVPLHSKRQIFDLGCGPGNSTAVLMEAFPESEVTGIDLSPSMLKRAREQVSGAHFMQGDLQSWLPPSDADLLFSNATFQWIPDHAAVMVRLLSSLKPGAVLAIQMPDNVDEPSHVAMREVAADGRWRERLGGAVGAREKILSPHAYHDLLSDHATFIDLWRTTYYHHLANHAAIVEFVASTGLRPYLDPLSVEQQVEFKESYLRVLQQIYPTQADGTVMLPFPRLFIVAVRR